MKSDTQTLVLLIILFIFVFVSMYGKAVIQWGKNRFELGGKNEKSDKKKKRGCRDCILLLLGKKEKYEVKCDRIKNSILRNQMNFAEQKILEVEMYLLNTYRDDLTNARESTSFDQRLENKEFKLYQSALKNALYIVKDEVRHSFKENGFTEMGDTEFSTYVREKSKNLLDIGKAYMMNQYPYEGMIVSIEERFARLEYIPKIQDITLELFIKAKEEQNQAKDAIGQLQIELSEEIDELTKN